jgi:hypothetical protein
VQSRAVVPTRSPTLSEYLEYWLAEVAAPKLRPTTVSKYRSAVELHLRPGLGGQRLDKLTVGMVQRFLNARRASGDSPQKLRMIREVLSSALGRAVREELVARNVAQLTTLPTEQRARRTAWTATQARAFLTAAEGDPAHPFFTLAVVYGMRDAGGARSLPFADVLDRAGAVRTVRAGDAFLLRCRCHSPGTPALDSQSRTRRTLTELSPTLSITRRSCVNGCH